MSESRKTVEHLFQAELGGVPLIWGFRFAETERYLRKWISGSVGDSSEYLSENAAGNVRVSEREFQDWASYGNRIDAFAEFCLLCQQTSEALLRYDRCVFHAGAIRYKDKACLIAGGSGVGKSTQIRTLMELFPGEISVINGDKPVLEYALDGTIIVHPSPWNGKEGWQGAEKAPLAGIFYLERGAENRIQRFDMKAAAPLLYLQIFQPFTSKETMHLAGALEEKILKSVPVWRFTNKDVPESTRLLMETMKEASHGL